MEEEEEEEGRVGEPRENLVVVGNGGTARTGALSRCCCWALLFCCDYFYGWASATATHWAPGG